MPKEFSRDKLNVPESMTAQQDPKIVPLSKFIGALDPWLEQVVLIGGWAHLLYRLDSRA
jgi:hypothetical protein